MSMLWIVATTASISSKVSLTDNYMSSINREERFRQLIYVINQEDF